MSRKTTKKRIKKTGEAKGKADSLEFHKAALKELTTRVGVYALCDLDGVPIYAGQRRSSIRGHVNRRAFLKDGKDRRQIKRPVR